MAQLEPGQRRIRHITSVQIRNLTPFPARDSLTSSLIQSPANFPNHLADDIDIALSRRRSRRISSTSANTIRSLQRSDGAASDTETSRAKTRATSRTRNAFQTHKPSTSTGSPPTARIAARSMSKASPHHQPSLMVDNKPIASSSNLAATHTSLQRHLEQVVSSRLVETFITLSIPSRAIMEGISSRPPSPATSTSSSKDKLVSAKPVSSLHKRSASAATTLSPRRGSFPTSPTRNSPSNRPSTVVSLKRELPSSSSPRKPPSKPVPVRQHNSSKSLSFPTPQAPPTPVTTPPKPFLQATPFYISPFHRLSTNPKFESLDPEHEYAGWADLSGSSLVVCIWGRVYEGEWGAGTGMTAPKRPVKDTGKGKAPAPSPLEPNNINPEERLKTWTKLAEWDFNLDELVHLPPMPSPSFEFTPNTLVLTIAGEEFYLPNALATTSNLIGGRPASPSTIGHISDTDIDGPNLKVFRKDVDFRGRREKQMTKSAGWGDLIKLVTLQSVLGDTEESLEQVVQSCDRLLEEDYVSHLWREVAERENSIKILVEQRDVVRLQLEQNYQKIQKRRELLENRRQILAQARDLLAEGRKVVGEQVQETLQESKEHAKLMSKLPPVRTTLLQTLSDIFPIEPVAPQDLLFSIVSVPLPIPLNNSDPAPPLSLPSYPTVNEETVAAALGYTAQAVHLLAAFLGMALVYPITCIGSRSLIKDPISAMVGPRMFPLYSKGVDTYRFEYAVFLLNKDIEMLMGDRNLRALDIRHTLPNLKNLLLTLTSGIAAELSPLPMSPSILPTVPESPTTTPVALAIPHSSSSAFHSIPSVRKQFLSPIAAMLRARYPSSIRAATLNAPAKSAVSADAADLPSNQSPFAEGSNSDADTSRPERSDRVNAEADNEGTSDDKTINPDVQSKFMGTESKQPQKSRHLEKISVSNLQEVQSMPTPPPLNI